MFTPCFLLPCYNHGVRIAATLASLREFDLPFIVVDDGSDRETADMLDQLLLIQPDIILLRHIKNQGKGAALISGFHEADSRGYTHVIQIDADGQHDVTNLPVLLNTAHANPQALISGAPRYDQSVPRGRLYGRYITHIWVWIETLSLSLQDSMCGFRAYPLQETLAVLPQLRARRMDFDTEIMVRLYWNNTPVKFVPVNVIYPEDNSSNFDVWRDNLSISAMHTRLVMEMPYRHVKRWYSRFSQSTHWSRTVERGSSIGLTLTFQIMKLFGRQALWLILFPVMAYFWLTGYKARQASAAYLQRMSDYRHSQDQDVASSQLNNVVVTKHEQNQNTFKHFLSFGRAIIDRISAWSGDLAIDSIDIPAAQMLRQLADQQQGLLILGSHLGSLELCRAIGTRLGGFKINAIVFNHHAKKFNELLRNINPDAGLNVIEVQDFGPETALLLDEKIAAGEWIVIVADRLSTTHESRVVMADFLGKPAPFPPGPFILAHLLACPVYLMFGLREADGLRLHVEKFAERIELPRAERQKMLDFWAQQYARRLEHYCMRAPLDWFNFYDFWQLSNEAK